MGASQGTDQVQVAVTGLHKVKPGQKTGPWGLKYSPQQVDHCPEINVKTSTWTRESHGLYDFEGKDVQLKQFKIKGSQRILRNESEVTVDQVDNYTKKRFIDDEHAMTSINRERIIARVLFKEGKYWLFHKHMIDENLQEVLEKKPEEKVWRIVKESYVPEMESPMIRLMKGDLIKVGRVRFKIRDIMSPVYQKIENEHNVKKNAWYDKYPQFIDQSLSQSKIMGGQSEDEEYYDEEESGDEDAQSNPEVPNEQLENVPGDVLVEAEQMLGDGSFDTDSEAENQIMSQQTGGMQRGGTRVGIVMADQETNPMRSNLGATMQGNNAQGFGESLNSQDLGGMTAEKHLAGIKGKKKKKKIPAEGKKPRPQSKHSVKEEPICRICLGEDNEEDNPLFAPCKCKGSMQLIHQNCLKTWFHNKRIKKQTPIVTTYFWRNLECELCKTAYPYEMKSLNGREMLNIIEYETPEPEYEDDPNYYIVLESISSNTSKVIHVVNMETIVKLYIGRGHDAHVRVTDISVSRVHAVLIKSTQGYYMLQDNDSKFGTLQLVSRPTELLPKIQNHLQIGRTVFNFEIKTDFSVLDGFCCMGAKAKKEIDEDPNQWHTINGVDYWPGAFADDSYNLHMAKRGQTQIRRNSKKGGDRPPNDHNLMSPGRGNILTQNDNFNASPRPDSFSMPGENMFMSNQPPQSSRRRTHKPRPFAGSIVEPVVPVRLIAQIGEDQLLLEDEEDLEEEESEEEESEEEDDSDQPDSQRNPAEQRRILMMEQQQLDEAIRQSMIAGGAQEEQKAELINQLDSEIRQQEEVLNNQSQVRPTLEIPPNDYEQDNEESKTILDNNVSLGRNNLKLNLQSQRMENTGGMNEEMGSQVSTQRVSQGGNFQINNKLATQRTNTQKAGGALKFGGLESARESDYIDHQQSESNMDVTRNSNAGTVLPQDTPIGGRTLNLHANEPILEEENKDNGEESEQENNLNGQLTNELGGQNTQVAPQE